MGIARSWLLIFVLVAMLLCGASAGGTEMPTWELHLDRLRVGGFFVRTVVGSREWRQRRTVVFRSDDRFDGWDQSAWHEHEFEVQCPGKLHEGGQPEVIPLLCAGDRALGESKLMGKLKLTHFTVQASFAKHFADIRITDYHAIIIALIG
jgi:hypothetical protein